MVFITKRMSQLCLSIRNRLNSIIGIFDKLSHVITALFRYGIFGWSKYIRHESYIENYSISFLKRGGGDCGEIIEPAYMKG